MGRIVFEKARIVRVSEAARRIVSEKWYERAQEGIGNVSVARQKGHLWDRRRYWIGNSILRWRFAR